MKMKVILIGALILAACLVPGCLDYKIVGTWTHDSILGKTTMTFNLDNTGVYYGHFVVYHFRWEKIGDTYVLTSTGDNIKLGTATLLNGTTLSVNAFGLVTTRFTKV